MISEHQKFEEIFRELRKVLDANDYDVVLRALRGLYYSFDPWLGDEAFRLYHELMPLRETSRRLFDLFLFGDELAPEEVETIFGLELMNDLLSVGILRRTAKSNIATDQYALMSQMGQYFFVTYPDLNAHNPRRVFDVYIGQDSYRLLHHLDRSRFDIKALDLCSGSGILGQAIVPWAQKVVAVDLSDEAILLSRANAILNGVSQRWEVRKGDLWQAVQGEKFDLIISNPPFVAVPIDVDFPIYGAGGEDGLLFIEKILDGLEEHFLPNGRAQLVFEGVGDAQNPIVVPLLEKFIEKHPQWSVKLLLYGRIYLWEQPLRLFGQAAAHIEGKPSEEAFDNITAEALKAFEKRGYRYMYRALLFVDSNPYKAQSGLEIMRFYNPWDLDSKPKIKWKVQYQEAPAYMLESERGVTLKMEALERELAEQFDGSKTIAEASQNVWQAHGGIMSSTKPGFYMTQAMELARIMHQLDLIEHPEGFWQQIQRTKNPFAVDKDPMELALDALENMFKMMQRLAQATSIEQAKTTEEKEEK